MNEWYKIASTSVGVDPRQAKHLRSAILSAGFEDVEKRVISIPIGEWPTDESMHLLNYPCMLFIFVFKPALYFFRST